MPVICLFSHAAILGLLILAESAAPVTSLSPDTHTLQLFQLSADPSLQTLNWTDRDPCLGRWTGVSCDEVGFVREIVLEGMHLTGPINMLSNLTQLRLLSLKDNALNGSLPDMIHWRNLRHLYLHNNKFEGPLPDSIAAMAKLLRFTASNNQLSGPIPATISKLAHLATLRLEGNQFSGLIPPIQLVNLSDFNISHNQLVGSIPPSLERFGASAFQQNPMLCGRILFPSIVCDGVMPKTVPSTQSTDPGMNLEKRKPGLSRGVIIAIVFGDAAVFLLISVSSVAYYWRKCPHRHDDEKSPKKLEEMDMTLTHYSPIKISSESDRGNLVFFENSNRFELSDLLRASAEMLGKGSFGTTYKAVLENCAVIAVKRMKEVNASSKKDFELKMDAIGRLWHPNVLPLRAFYFAKEEKLLVYDYEPHGSLHYSLHGNQRLDRTPLDWSQRFKIALGVAKALRYLHCECGKQKIAHGNIKSSNILLDENHRPLVADFGLSLILSPTAAASRVAGYHAPGHADMKRISQPSDVYSFGVVMLELLTGKSPASFHPSEKGIDLPKWVQSVVREEWTVEVFDVELKRHKDIEEDMVSMLQTALLCTEPIPERRPKMTVVVALLEKLSRDQSHFYDNNTPTCQSPAASEADTSV